MTNGIINITNVKVEETSDKERSDEMILESWHNAEDKARYKIVRTSDYTDVPGEIVTANEESGKCDLHLNGETKTLEFGAGGIRIVPRGRR